MARASARRSVFGRDVAPTCRRVDRAADDCCSLIAASRSSSALINMICCPARPRSNSIAGNW